MRKPPQAPRQYQTGEHPRKKPQSRRQAQRQRQRTQTGKAPPPTADRQRKPQRQRQRQQEQTAPPPNDPPQAPIQPPQGTTGRQANNRPPHAIKAHTGQERRTKDHPTPHDSRPKDHTTTRKPTTAGNGDTQPPDFIQGSPKSKTHIILMQFLNDFLVRF